MGLPNVDRVILRILLANRTALVAENLALRQQLVVLRRSTKRPRLRQRDRIFWVWISKLWRGWRSALFVVQPETVVRWHRRGLRLYWRWKSRNRGRPLIDPVIRSLTRRMPRENPLWGAPRIQAELALLGHDVAESTVAKYMVRHRPGPPSQTWRSFLKNHMHCTAACDFFVVPTATFRLLYCFVILAHGRRRIVQFNVTNHPTAHWTAQQIVEAFPADGSEPRDLLRDRDSIYGDHFRQWVHNTGIRQILISPRSPWQNPYVERVIGSLRRECLNHVIVLSEAHLKRILLGYIAYYHAARPHSRLDGNSSLGREVETPSNGPVIAIPQVGGLHPASMFRAPKLSRRS
jgi:transposase InsO family protein